MHAADVLFRYGYTVRLVERFCMWTSAPSITVGRHMNTVRVVRVRCYTKIKSNSPTQAIILKGFCLQFVKKKKCEKRGFLLISQMFNKKCQNYRDQQIKKKI